jgi:hypothetical protein
MDTKAGFLQESDGSNSSMRLAFIIVLIWSILACSYLIVFVMQQPLSNMKLMDIALFFTTVNAPFALTKVIQKFSENKSTSLSNVTNIANP